MSSPKSHVASVPCVLISGAGPTGLVLALGLARRKVPFRLIDEKSGPGEHSRAMGVHARTLEFYRQFGFADEVVAKGVVANAIHLREGGPDGHGREVASFDFKDIGEGISPYPFILAFAQDDHERLLVQKLKDTGADVEWNCKLKSFEQNSDLVSAAIEHADGRVENAEFAYICGCDGARSAVRRSMGVSFSGGTYEQHFYVADVKIDSGFKKDVYFNLGAHILTLMLPVRSSGMQRLIGLVPAEMSQREDLTFEDIRNEQETLLDVKVTEVNWFSTYRVHHRVAEHFRVGRAFLLGDAGHVHSPVGAQGMNTGIGDAINLGWKLADVMRGRAKPVLLESYEPERIGFARALVNTTDRVFTGATNEGAVGALMRQYFMPLFLSVATRLDFARQTLFRFASQTRIHYSDSPLSEGQAGHVHGGDRLPWVQFDGSDNFAPLQSLDWQVHVYGQGSEELKGACRELELPMHVFPWSDTMEKAGFEQDAVYLVRPDGYIAVAASVKDAEGKLVAFANRFFKKTSVDGLV